MYKNYITEIEIRNHPVAHLFLNSNIKSTPSELGRLDALGVKRISDRYNFAKELYFKGEFAVVFIKIAQSARKRETTAIDGREFRKQKSTEQSTYQLRFSLLFLGKVTQETLGIAIAK